MEEQEDSLETQQAAYTNLISMRSDWELVGIYSDSLSGLSAEKRPEFMRMISDAMEGKIDRILCKSVSRFSRNVAECKKYTDLLKLKNVIVEFEKEHISTADTTSAFIFSLMSAIAENESRSISENVKWSQRERVKRGEYNLGNNRILGYDCVDGKLVPNQDADAVRCIYTLFLEGRSIPEIQKYLADIGILTRNGTPLSCGNIRYILKNETYRGDKLLQKTHPKDLITKKPDPRVEFESNYLSGDHEAIVSKAVWDAVQAKLKKNKEFAEVVGHRGGQPHFLYGRRNVAELSEMTGIRENTLLYRLQIGFPTELLCIPPDTTSKIRWMAPFFEGKAIWLDKEKERCIETAIRKAVECMDSVENHNGIKSV